MYIFNFRYKSNLGICTSYMIWRKEYGRPNTVNLEKWIKSFEQSCRKGCNKHFGYNPDNPIICANIFDQFKVIVTWTRK